MNASQQTETAFENFLAWYSCVRLIPYDVEFKLYDDVGRVAGTCDFYGFLEWPEKKVYGDYYLDWKTSLYVNRNSHGPQIAEYKRIDGRNPKAGIGVVYFPKNEIGKPVWFDATKKEDEYLEQFSLARRLYYLRHPQKARKAGL